MEGRADPAAIVRHGEVRFTVLTPRLIRMEWSAEARFVDAPSQAFVSRNQPVPSFSSRIEDGVLHLETEALGLTYRLDSGRFSAENLQIRSIGLAPAFTWKPGDAATGNLHGTACTLDRYDGNIQIDSGEPMALEPGLLSRDGWHVVDDTDAFLFDDSGWIKPRSDGESQDLYFFGYGHQYTKALGDYALVADRQPMPPRFTFGYWWSRYWNYSDAEVRGLVENFKRYDLPLDVFVIDMDWHRTDGLGTRNWDAFGQPAGWTGYSWNRSLLPEPEKFLEWLRSQKLKTTLNLHPASGMLAHEDAYPAFASAMGVEEGAPIPFEAADQRFMDNLFELVLGPLEDQGVNFWWLDWQQWPQSKALPGLSNTWWLNHLFYTNMQRKNEARALIYHRWGGLGNHRYQIGFSGDSVISWASLAYQPYFTATASNVLYGYWSHDIGGHMFTRNSQTVDGGLDPELFVRWTQFGAFSPILRTHSAKDARLHKEPWGFSAEILAALRQAIELRYALVPYIYAAARQAYDSGVSILRPLYYAWPEEDQAYACDTQYMFGDDMLLAPVVQPMQEGVAEISIWLPPGRWYDANRGELLEGGQTISRDYTLDEVPLFIRAGAVVPANPPGMRNLQEADDGRRVLRIYPGGEADIRLYDDAGDSEGYRGDAYMFTAVKSRRDAACVMLEIGAGEGFYPGRPESRQFTIELPDASWIEEVIVDGRPLLRSDDDGSAGYGYDGETLTARVSLPPLQVDQALRVEIRFATQPAEMVGLRYRMKRAAAAVRWLKQRWWGAAPLPDTLSLLGQLGRLIDYRPEQLAAHIDAFDRQLLEVPAHIEHLAVLPEAKEQFAALLEKLRCPAP